MESHPKGRALTEEETRHVLAVMERWLRGQLPDDADDGSGGEEEQLSF